VLVASRREQVRTTGPISNGFCQPYVLAVKWLISLAGHNGVA
jgi:hypothetical protein